ncbi:MAG: hypothetical protein WAW06_10330 [bacterium]
MLRPSDRLAGAVLAAGIAALAAAGGCDWFEAQPEENWPPETELTAAPPEYGAIRGQDVTFAWAGSDLDGQVVSYEWAYDNLAGPEWVPTAETSVVIEDVTLGDHYFQVRGVDDRGALGPAGEPYFFTAGIPRLVLAEFLTTNICRNCPNAEEALNDILGEVGVPSLAVVGYHDLTASDKLATDETVERIDWYTSTGIPADQWPIVLFDGGSSVEGAETPEDARALYAAKIAQRLAVGSPVRLTIAGTLGSGEGSVAVGVKVLASLPGGAPVMHLVVVEDSVRYKGYFADIYDFVARDLLEDEALTIAAAGDSVLVERVFPVGETWAVDNLDVVAFIQDTESREIIQAVRLKQD